MKNERAPIDPAVAANEKQSGLIDVDRAFGDDWHKLSAKQQQRVLDATPESDPELYETLQEAMRKNSGEMKIDQAPVAPDTESDVDEDASREVGEDDPKRAGGLLRGLARKAVGLGKMTQAGLKNTYWAATKPLSFANWAASSFIANRTEAAQKWSDTYNSMSKVERERHKNRVRMMGLFTVMGAGAILLVSKYSGYEHHDVPQTAGAGGVNPDDAPTDPALRADEHTVRDPQGHTDPHANRVRGWEDNVYSERYNVEKELNWLHNNGRHGNDFNSITAQELNDPANKDHFPGYTSLKDQYEHSPAELSAQLRQIKEIELAKGHSLDFLPEDLRKLAGADSSKFMTSLQAAIAKDPELHSKLTAATLDYIQHNGQPLRGLTEHYKSDYIMIMNGVPTVMTDPDVVSADPNDSVIMLSATKGIRYPCGQPIEIKPRPVVVPAAPHQTVAVQHHTVERAPTPSPQNISTPPQGGDITPPPTGGGGETPTPPGGGETPVAPAPKNEADNFDHSVPDQTKQNGAQVGSGSLDSRQQVTRPSADFTPGRTSAPDNDNSAAPGVSTSAQRPGGGLFGRGQQTPGGLNTPSVGTGSSPAGSSGVGSEAAGGNSARVE